MKMQDGLIRKGRTAQHCLRISEALKGNKNSLGSHWKMSIQGRRNISASHVGNVPWNKGLKGFRAGPKNNNWRGGISKNPYPNIFNRTLKLAIRRRDNFQCQLCWKTEAKEVLRLGRVLCVNHIDFNKQNCSEENLNALCAGCNAKINHSRRKWTAFFQEQMKCRLLRQQ